MVMPKTSDDLNHSSMIRFSRRFEDSFHDRQNKTEDSEQTEIEKKSRREEKRIKVKKCFLFFVKSFTLSVLSINFGWLYDKSLKSFMIFFVSTEIDWFQWYIRSSHKYFYFVKIFIHSSFYVIRNVEESMFF